METMTPHLRHAAVRAVLGVAAIFPSAALQAAAASLAFPEAKRWSGTRRHGKTSRLRRFGARTALVRKRLTDVEILGEARRRAGMTDGTIGPA
jgi:hypothetical protein